MEARFVRFLLLSLVGFAFPPVLMVRTQARSRALIVVGCVVIAVTIFFFVSVLLGIALYAVAGLYSIYASLDLLEYPGSE
jgi:hypothetical protein